MKSVKVPFGNEAVKEANQNDQEIEFTLGTFAAPAAPLENAKNSYIYQNVPASSQSSFVHVADNNIFKDKIEE